MVKNDVNRFNLYTDIYDETNLGLNKVPSTVVLLHQLLCSCFLLHEQFLVCILKSSVMNKPAILKNSVGPQSAILKKFSTPTDSLFTFEQENSEYRALWFQIKVVAFFSLALGEGVSENKRIN